MMQKTKHTLRFRNDGTFRVLMMSDIQDKLDYDPRTLTGMRRLIEETDPDLVIWGGDNCDGRKLKKHEELREYLKIFTVPMEEKQIPWMHVFGNHDYDIEVSGEEQSRLYEEYPHCISMQTPGIPGVTNYMVPVLAHDSDHVAYAIYAFDSKYKDVEYRPGVTVDDVLLPNRPKHFRKWDTIRFEQQLWYWNLSKALEAQEGHLVRAMAVMHVPPHEITMVINNPEQSGYIGFADEKLHCPMLNSGVYATMLERGDVDIIAAGHLHRDVTDGVYGGIRICLDACAGFAPSGDDQRRGGRVFVIREDGSYDTEMLYYKDLMDITPAGE